MCTKCLKANILQKIIPKTQQTKLANNFGKQLHINIWGPVSITGYSSIKYLLTIVDNITCWVEMLLLKLKSNTYTEYIKHTMWIYTNLSIKIKTLQSDNNTVFLSKDFTDYLNSQETN